MQVNVQSHEEAALLGLAKSIICFLFRLSDKDYSYNKSGVKWLTIQTKPWRHQVPLHQRLQ